ncbi:hypothetical protein [Luteibacter sp. RCC_6_2]|uniref:hypothetical protein n=1 Tax=Luteibacter sp. RCC_6_2 TaxID=3239223 RepID=UPI00352529E4
MEVVVEQGINAGSGYPLASAGSGRRQLRLTPGRYHRLVQVIGQVQSPTGGDALASARAVAVRWLEEKTGWRLTDEQASGTDSIELEKDDSTQTLAIESAPGLWGVRFDDPCKQMPGRQWRIELVLVDIEDGAATAFGCTLSVLVPASEPEFAVSPGLPGIVRLLATSHELQDGGRRLDGTVLHVDRERDIDDLIAFIEDRNRPVSVVVVSEPRTGAPFVSPGAVGSWLSGLAFVVSVSPEAAQELTRRYGRRLGVFGDAIRMYRVGFDADIDDPFRHPLFTAQSWSDRIQIVKKQLQFDAMQDSVSRRDEKRDLPGFAVVRRTAAAQRIREVVGAEQATTEVAELLRRAMDSLRKDAEDWQTLAQSEERRADMAVEAQREMRGRFHTYRAHIQRLEAQLADLGAKTRGPNPTSLDALVEWAEEHFTGRLIITPKAANLASACDHAEPDKIFEALALLAGPYWDMKFANGARSDFETASRELGMSVGPTGDGVDDRRYAKQYSASWEGQSYKLAMHLQGSDSRDPRVCIRIYFAIDEEEQLLIVGHLPTHLRNSLT